MHNPVSFKGEPEYSGEPRVYRVNPYPTVIAPPSSGVKCLWVFVWGLVCCSCRVCVGVGGVVLCRCVCVCDLLIFLHEY